MEVCVLFWAEDTFQQEVAAAAAAAAVLNLSTVGRYSKFGLQPKEHLLQLRSLFLFYLKWMNGALKKAATVCHIVVFVRF